MLRTATKWLIKTQMLDELMPSPKGMPDDPPSVASCTTRFRVRVGFALPHGRRHAANLESVLRTSA